MKITPISAEEYNIYQINQIKHKYPDYRQRSKMPTFALTYGGNWRTIMKDGFSEEESREIEKNYHELYKQSDKWVDDRLKQAENDGYVTLAFGLRLRTPLLQKCVIGDKKTLYEATKERKSAGNALGQSWGLLNCRAVNEVMEQVWKSPYRNDILPCGQIHDASYYFVKDDIDTLLYLNKILSKAMKWQEDPAIAHDEVHLSGELDIFYPSWRYPTTIPNDCNRDKLIEVINANK